MGVIGQLHASYRFRLEETDPGTNKIEGWVSTKDGSDPLDEDTYLATARKRTTIPWTHS